MVSTKSHKLGVSSQSMTKPESEQRARETRERDEREPEGRASGPMRAFKGIAAVATLLATIPGILAFVIGDPSPYEQFRASLRPAPVELYLTADPLEAPEAQSTSSNFLGVTSGMTIGDIEEHFGGKDEVRVLYSGSGENARKVSFIRDGFSLTVTESLASGATSLESLSIYPYDYENYAPSAKERLYASLPDGLLLGHSTTRDALALDIENRETTAYGATFETAEWTEISSAESFTDGAMERVIYTVDHGEWGKLESGTSAYGAQRALTDRGCDDLVSKVYLGDETWEPFTESSFKIENACQ